jgi:cytoskeleton protein RodZ
MTSIGETLRRERVRRGWNLDEVAAETKISLHLLEAIEADQFDRLPGGVFARNFVRQYAQMLELDEDEILSAFRHQFEEPAQMEPEPGPPPFHVSRVTPIAALSDRLGPGNSLSAFVGLVVVIVLCSGVYSLWQRARRSPPPPETAAVAPAPKPQLAVQPAEAPKPEFRPAEVSDTGAIRVPETAAPKPVATIPAAGAPGEASAVRVAFTATEPVWVSVRTDGTHTYSGTLEGQQTREFDAAQKMTVLVGNAGGLDLSLNGKPVGPFGGKGEIRLVVLTPSGAQVVPRTPRTSEDSTAPTEPVSATDRP